jgi:NHLM bacteriocin system ABC transporter peptidase/ATP-binding protein
VPAFTRVFVDYYLVGGLRSWLPIVLGGLILTALLVAAFTWLQQESLLRLQTKLALTMTSKFVWHVLRLPVGFFTQRYASEISSRVAVNDRVAELLSGDLATNLLNGVLVIFYVVIMVQYDAVLTAIAVAIAVLNVVALRTVARRRADQSRRLLHERGRLLATVFNGLLMIETLKAGSTESDFFTRWAGSQAKVLNAEQELGLATQVLGAVPPFLLGINTTAVLVVGGLRVIDGQLTIGALIAFQVLLLGFLLPINGLVDLGQAWQEVAGDMGRLDDVLHSPADPPAAPGPSAADATTATARLSGQVELRNVTFGYSRLEPPLISDLSLSLRPGARVALVGASGSGKTTVARLIGGLYAPWEGEILFDGQPRPALPRTLLTNSLAFVDQDVFLFEGTIKENLTLWDTTIPETHILQAAKDALIHEEISARPDSYEHVVEEGGRNFSGGERQRLEIARALVGNPTILVLDEATSALDPATERSIDDHLRRRGCTCLIIAHRLSTIRDCDEILVLERGTVVQRGTHETLRRQRGPYARLIKADEGSKAASYLEALS